jgi:hypothetical protein
MKGTTGSPVEAGDEAQGHYPAVRGQLKSFLLAVNMLIINKINDLTVPKSAPLKESIYSKSSC